MTTDMKHVEQRGCQAGGDKQSPAWTGHCLHGLRSLAALATLLLLAACSSGGGDEETTVTPSDNAGNNVENTGNTGNTGSKQYTINVVDQAPDWHVNWQSDQTRPDWVEPSPGRFEFWDVILVDVHDQLKPYTSAQDLMAVFDDSGLCGLAGPAYDPGTENYNPNRYVMKVYANVAKEGGNQVTLRYYCDKLHQIFTAQAVISFGNDDEMETLVPDFMAGSGQYPVTVTLLVELDASQAADMAPGKGDMLAAFVGNDCRGVYTLQDETTAGTVQLQAYGQQKDETLTLRYYHAATRRVLTFSKRVGMVESRQNVKLSL